MTFQSDHRRASPLVPISLILPCTPTIDPTIVTIQRTRPTTNVLVNEIRQTIRPMYGKTKIQYKVLIFVKNFFVFAVVFPFDSGPFNSRYVCSSFRTTWPWHFINVPLGNLTTLTPVRSDLSRRIDDGVRYGSCPYPDAMWVESEHLCGHHNPIR